MNETVTNCHALKMEAAGGRSEVYDKVVQLKMDLTCFSAYPLFFAIPRHRIFGL
jgi:hypothetical protein